MRYDELPVYEIGVVFAATPDRANDVMELVDELVCEATGGRGEGDDHVCGGFHCAGIRELPDGLLENVLDRLSSVTRAKLVWFVPEDALDATRDAVFAAGAGRIGEYERCSWYAAGTGTFLGGDATSPALGERGREERVSELRVETIVPVARLDEVVAALRVAHPYEEPAFDVYPLVDA